MKRWQQFLEESYRSLDDLKEPLGLTDGQIESLRPFEERYPILVTPYYLRLMNRLDPEDPIRTMCLPHISPRAADDASGADSEINGGQHKYQQSVLIVSNNQTLSYSRNCYRKDFRKLDPDEVKTRIPKLAEYISERPEIDNISIAGGDAFLNSNELLGQYLKAFAFLPTIGYIRFTTSTPATFPQRISNDPELINMLARYAKAKAIIIVTQFDHPRELTDEAAAAVRMLREAGCTVRNEAVLLHGVNDDAKTIYELMNGLVSIGVEPYYLYQCRTATDFDDHFQVPLADGIRMVGEAKATMSGMAKSFRYIMGHTTGKIQMLGFTDDGQAVFKYHEAKDPANEGRIFTQELDEAQTWLA